MVSVIVPVYNAKLHIEKCVNSLLKQSFVDIEIILIDDGSIDGSDKICDSFAETYEQVQVFHKENGGVSTARNLGLDKARGEFVVFVDADDSLENDALEKMIQRIEFDKLDIVIAGKYINYYDKKEVFLPLTKSDNLYSKKDVSSVILYLNESSNFDVLWNKMYRRSFIEKNHIRFQEFATTSQDLIFNVDIFVNNPSIGLIPNAFYHYYKSLGETIVSKYHKNMYDIMIERRKKLYELFDYYGLNNNESQKWLEKAYLETIFNCLINMYRPGSVMKFRERLKFIQSLYLDYDLFECCKSPQQYDSRQMVVLFAKLIYKKETVLIEILFGACYKINQLVKRIKYAGNLHGSV